MRLTPDNMRYYLGTLRHCHLGYSAHEEIRAQCASGGIVSTILVELLERGLIDGALVSHLECSDGTIRGHSFIATSRESILRSTGSIYCDVATTTFSALKDFGGRLAVVGLPCYLNGLNRMLSKDEELRKQIYLKIGLFCGHNSRKELLLRLLEKKKIPVDQIERLVFRRGHWRGNMCVALKDGRSIHFPFSHFSLYQNLHFFSQEKCLYCGDHTAEGADISCGDVWLRKMKSSPIKHSVFLSRTERSDEVLEMLMNQGAILARDSSPQEVFLSQKRALLHHKSLYARARLGRLFGFDIPCPEKGGVRWNDYLSNLISLTNVRLSANAQFKKLLFHIPRRVLFFYLLIFKFFTNF